MQNNGNAQQYYRMDDYGGHVDDHLLPGQRFVPMEDELLLCYLKPLVHGKQVPGRNLAVFDCDLYGDQEPWEIWETYKDRRANDLRKNKDLFFFTQQKKKTPKDSRVGRTVGSGGTWKEESGKPVKALGEDRVIGYKKTFGFKKQDSPHEGCWIMLEYELDPSQLVHRKQETNYVICVLRKKKNPDNKKLKQREQTNRRHNSLPSTSNAPPQPLGSGAVKDEPEQCLRPPCVNDHNNGQLVYDFPGDDNLGMQQFEDGRHYWGQQFVFPSGDDKKSTKF